MPLNLRNSPSYCRADRRLRHRETFRCRGGQFQVIVDSGVRLAPVKDKRNIPHFDVEPGEVIAVGRDAYQVVQNGRNIVLHWKGVVC